MPRGTNKSPLVWKHGRRNETEAEKRAVRERLRLAQRGAVSRLPNGPNGERFSAQPRDEDDLLATAGRAPVSFEEAK